MRAVTRRLGAAARPPLGPSKPAFRDANVLRWLAAYTASMIGDGVYFLALGWAAQQATGPAQVGTVLAVGAVPRAVLMLGGGVLADRFGPRRVVLGSDAVRCAVILAVATLLLLGSPGLWPLLVAALVFGVVDAVFLPAVGALPPRLTDPGQLARLQGMAQLAVRGGTIAGPPLAGAAMGFGGPGVAFAVAGALFAVSLALLVTVHLAPLPLDEKVSDGPGAGEGPMAAADGSVPGAAPARATEGAVPGSVSAVATEGAGAVPGTESAQLRAAAGADADVPGATTRLAPVAVAPERGGGSEAPATAASAPSRAGRGGLRELRAGLRYVLRHPLIRPVVLAGTLAEVAVVGPMNVGLVLLAGARGWGAGGVAALVAAFGVGAACSALALALAGRVPAAGRVMLATMVAAAGAVAAIGLAPGLGWAVVAAGCAGLFGGTWGGLGRALVQTAAAPSMLGRVSSVQLLGAIGIAPLCYPVFGFAAELLDVGTVFALCAAVSLLGVGFALASTEVRRARLAR